MSKELSDMKKVLVTGSSRGIGKEIALYLAKNGYDIDIHYVHNKQKAVETVEEIKALGRDAQILKFDIKTERNVQRFLTVNFTTE